MQLRNKIAIVTGAASGVEKAIANLYAKEGAKVAVSDPDPAGAKDTAAEIEANGGTAIALKTNVAKEDDIQILIDKTVNTFGSVDILVNSSGIMESFCPVTDITDDLWNRVFAFNTTSVMRSTRKVLPIFIDKGFGVIINIVSTAGLRSDVLDATYTASQNAIIGFTKNVGFQYAKRGIRCNAIALGNTTADLSLNPSAEQLREVATVALFLASDDGIFINSNVLVVEKGWLVYK